MLSSLARQGAWYYWFCGTKMSALSIWKAFNCMYILLNYCDIVDHPHRFPFLWLLQVHIMFPAHPVSPSIYTEYPKKYAHGFVVLCFVVVMQSFIMNSHEVFIHIHLGCFAGTGAIVRLPQCQWSKPDGYGKISQCITTTKHSKAKTVCIFLGIYCMRLYISRPFRREVTVISLGSDMPQVLVGQAVRGRLPRIFSYRVC